VLELEGESWRSWLEEQRSELEEAADEVARGLKKQSYLEERKKDFEEERLTHSRLFAIDAGVDPAALRRSYRDREHYLILPAVFDISVYRPRNDETGRREQPKIAGRIQRLLVGDIHVNKAQSEQLSRFRGARYERRNADPFEEPEEFEPRYAVTLKVGMRNEPWIDRIRILDD
jgi:hypothetical protein